MQTNHIADTVTVKITANDRGNPPGKLAVVGVHFVGDWLFAGLKLVGFSICERRGGSGRNVTCRHASTASTLSAALRASAAGRRRDRTGAAPRRHPGRLR
jgi:hypothetical protein